MSGRFHGWALASHAMLDLMGDWVKVEFWAQLSDGLEIVEINDDRVREELSRFFGFSRVANLTISDVIDGEAPPTRTLYENRPSEGRPIFPSS